MSVPEKFDVLIIGSGPCGAMAADALVSKGRSVCVVDYGSDDPARRDLVPDKPFSELRRSDPDQARYFLGEKLQGVPLKGVRVGAQLTASRQFVSAGSDQLLPIESSTFDPMQSLAIGGLGAAWGSACFTFSATELARCGLPASGWDHLYANTVQRVGVSVGEQARPEWWSGVEGQQPGLEIDDNAKNVLRRYETQRAKWEAQGFYLGSMPIAALSQPLPGRNPNPLHDMDFYSDSRRSVFRPRYTIEELQASPNFKYEKEVLVTSFRESEQGVEVEGQRNGQPVTFRARRLMLCAGAINSARLALASLPELGDSTTLLCNPMTYMPTLNLGSFGRAVGDRRHSLAQLAAYLEGDSPEDGDCSVQIYSYRALLLFKLIKEMPLPTWAGLLVARSMVNAMTIFGAWFPDSLAPSKTMTVQRSGREGILPSLQIQYALTEEEKGRRLRLEKKLRRLLPKILCLPIGRVDPGAAGSIHYAGTIPFQNPVNPKFTTSPEDRLAHLRHVFVGDNASWTWLPHKGPTLTAMANARRVADSVDQSL